MPDEPRVRAPPREQFLVRSRLDQSPLLHHANSRRVLNGAQSVRDDQHRVLRHGASERLLHYRLALGVERGRRLVQQQHGRFPNERARDGHSLFLPPREHRTPLADGFLVRPR